MGKHVLHADNFLAVATFCTPQNAQQPNVFLFAVSQHEVPWPVQKALNA
jgi:hypothetical protein